MEQNEWMRKDAEWKMLLSPYKHMIAPRNAGISCPEGWRNQFLELLSNIDRHQKDNTVDSPIQLFQVKEKFGGIRIYYNGGDNTIHDMVNAATRKIDSTCEVCGNPGKLRGGSWLQTLCDEHSGGREIWKME